MSTTDPPLNLADVDDSLIDPALAHADFFSGDHKFDDDLAAAAVAAAAQHAAAEADGAAALGFGHPQGGHELRGGVNSQGGGNVGNEHSLGAGMGIGVDVGGVGVGVEMGGAEMGVGVPVEMGGMMDQHAHTQMHVQVHHGHDLGGLASHGGAGPSGTSGDAGPSTGLGVGVGVGNGTGVDHTHVDIGDDMGGIPGLPSSTAVAHLAPFSRPQRGDDTPHPELLVFANRAEFDVWFEGESSWCHFVQRRTTNPEKRAEERLRARIKAHERQLATMTAEEAASAPPFKRRRRNRTSNIKEKVTFTCHHAGRYVARHSTTLPKEKLRLNTKKSVKCDCPARIVLTEMDDDECKVSYFWRHEGHDAYADDELESGRLPKIIDEWLVAQIQAGKDTDEIRRSLMMTEEEKQAYLRDIADDPSRIDPNKPPPLALTLRIKYPDIYNRFRKLKGPIKDFRPPKNSRTARRRANASAGASGSGGEQKPTGPDGVPPSTAPLHHPDPAGLAPEPSSAPADSAAAAAASASAAAAAAVAAAVAAPEPDEYTDAQAQAALDAAHAHDHVVDHTHFTLPGVNGNLPPDLDLGTHEGLERALLALPRGPGEVASDADINEAVLRMARENEGKDRWDGVGL